MIKNQVYCFFLTHSVVKILTYTVISFHLNSYQIYQIKIKCKTQQTCNRPKLCTVLGLQYFAKIVKSVILYFEQETQLSQTDSA